MTTTLVDRIGGNDGTVQNATVGVFWGEGKGKAVFDGVDESIALPNSATFNVSGTATIECWIKLDGASSGSNILFSLSDKDASEVDEQFVILGAFTAGLSDETIGVQQRQGSVLQHQVATREGTTDPFDGNVHFISVVWDTVSSSPLIYMDGVLQTLTVGVSGSTYGGVPNIDVANIGAIERPTPGAFFDGAIGSVRFYSLANTAAQVDQNFRAERQFYGI